MEVTFVVVPGSVYPDLLAVVSLPEIIDLFKDLIEIKSDDPV